MSQPKRKWSEIPVLLIFVGFVIGILFCIAAVKFKPATFSLIEIKKMETTVGELSSSLDKCAIDIYNRDSQVTKLEKEDKETQQKLTEKTKESENFKKEKDNLQKENDSLKKQKEEMEEKVKELEKERDEMKADLDKKGKDEKAKLPNTLQQ